MLFYNTIGVMYDGPPNHNMQQFTGYIKNNIKLDNIQLHPNITELFKGESEIYKIYSLSYSEIHKIDNKDIKFRIILSFLKVIQPELFTPQIILKIRDYLHQHYIHVNNVIDNDANNNKMDLFMHEIQNKTQEINHKIEINQQTTLVTKLFSYQLKCINWMNLMELDIIDNTIDISNDRIIKLENGIHYNFIKNNFLTHEDVLKMKHNIRGGIIANEVGTGKTAIAIGHIMNDNNNNLILVPSHLKQHWINEFQKHTSLDILNIYNVTLFTFDEIQKYTIDELKNMTQYTRIIIDEIHEIYDKIILDNLSYIPNIKYRWGITGTPIINRYSLYNILTYLLGKSTRQFYNKLIGNEHIFQKAFTKFFQRTMKNDIYDSIKLPNLSINNILLNFSQIEQQIYDLESGGKSNIDFLRKLCCDILLSIENNNSQGVTIKELKKQILEFLTKQYNKELDELELLGEQIKTIKLNILKKDNGELVNVTHLEFNLTHYEQLYQEQKKTCDQRKVIMERYTEILDKIENIMDVDEKDTEDTENNEDSCSICLGTYTSPITYLIPCGHYYCKACFDSSYRNSNHNCPMCRMNIEKKDMLTVSKDITNYVSTKYKEVIKLITIDNQENFVIYTQYPHILQNLKIHIERFNITCGYLEDFMLGNNPQILLMSSDTMSSGIDLTYYNNVIIFEPFMNYVYSREKEKQIIGRLHRINQTNEVNVFRLIIKDTIEEEIYNL
jgi:SNF2 family DNA or RNA helicase